MNNTSSFCLKTYEGQICEENYGNTLYVGGTGPNNYSTIQSAINDTYPGDTVFVYNDSSPYYENLIIAKYIILKGEEKNTTIIDGSRKKEVIFISSNSVEINNFMIKNSSTNSSGILVFKYANYVKISGNIIKENGRGIFLYNPGYHMDYPIGKNLGPDENYIENNFIINNSIGISLHGSNNNLICKNWIQKNNCGINIAMDDYPTAPPSFGNRITRNVFIKNIKSAFDECNNKWISNYWDDWVGFKYKIFGFLPYRIPGTFRLFVNLDWFPAKDPIKIV
jgi:parallel beta-helix repeat protein